MNTPKQKLAASIRLFRKGHPLQASTLFAEAVEEDPKLEDSVSDSETAASDVGVTGDEVGDQFRILPNENGPREVQTAETCDRTPAKEAVEAAGSWVFNPSDPALSGSPSLDLTQDGGKDFYVAHGKDGHSAYLEVGFFPRPDADEDHVSPDNYDIVDTGSDEIGQGSIDEAEVMLKGFGCSKMPSAADWSKLLGKAITGSKRPSLRQKPVTSEYGDENDPIDELATSESVQMPNVKAVTARARARFARALSNIQAMSRRNLNR